MPCLAVCEITNGERCTPCGPNCPLWNEFRQYADEFTKANDAGQSSCGQLNDGTWARCSRPKGHELEHAALDDNLCTVVTWDQD